MNEYSIITGNLHTGLDTPYCKEGNKIDVYSSVYWTAENEVEYEKKENIIANWRFENELVKCNAWCDISGYDYWVLQQEEENYVSIDVVLKKQPSEYTQEEMSEIHTIIDRADIYFSEELF